MESEIDLLKQKNARLMAKNYKLEAEIVKLRQIIDENARRDVKVMELEQKNMELEARLAVLEQSSLVVGEQPQNDKKAIVKVLPEMDAFLVEVNKKSIGDKIRERSAEPVTLPEQVVKELTPACKLVISGNKSPVKSFMVNKQASTSENIDMECQKIPYNQKVEQDLRRELSSTEIGNSKMNKAFDIQISELSLEAILMGSSEVTAQNIVDLFRVAIKFKRKEILCWYCYYKAYKDRVRDVKSKNGINDKSVRTLVYSEIKPLLPDITDIQDIINNFPKKAINIDDAGYEGYEDSIPNWNRHTLDYYPNLYREFSSENFDYYGITDETSYPLCKLDHSDGESIEEKGNMSKSDKVLIPKYLDWHAKLTGLPSVLTDKIRSSLYKKYKKETGYEPWQLSEAIISISEKPQASDFKPITFKVKPDLELIIKSMLEHFTYLKF
ncbi:hypothetical protein C1645_817710 [Glomus cerebriforme]|uniref:Uncharacterized protein n=1 Tax=Glomus cerebriforme TaxID=658196 RepID=A0A397TDV7_9GLOM|nr:hypothetical protein C1645_817710 [Glomus cerebriforme]